VHYSLRTLAHHLAGAGFRTERLYTALGDYSLQRLQEIAVATHPELNQRAAFEAWRRKIEADQQGEEIRFFARKPDLDVGYQPRQAWHEIPAIRTGSQPGDLR